MIDNMKNFARVIEAKSKELAIEKRRTEYLLYRMLPKSVAEQLKLVSRARLIVDVHVLDHCMLS